MGWVLTVNWTIFSWIYLSTLFEIFAGGNPETSWALLYVLYGICIRVYLSPLPPSLPPSLHRTLTVPGVSFTQKLHIIYLINDVVHHWWAAFINCDLWPLSLSCMHACSYIVHVRNLDHVHVLQCVGACMYCTILACYMYCACTCSLWIVDLLCRYSDLAIVYGKGHRSCNR